MKYIIIAAFLILNFDCLSAQSQYPPILLKDTTDTAYLLWQIQCSPLTTTGSSADGVYRLTGGHVTTLPLSSSCTTADGLRIQAVRVLDTVNNGNFLRNTIFPLAVFHVFDDTLSRVKYSDSAFDFGKLDIDTTKTTKVVIKNAGNSTLHLPKGFYFQKDSKMLTASDTVTSIHIQRNDPIRNKEIQWQIRQHSEPPKVGDSLKYAERQYDALKSSLNPGEADSFYIDVRPIVIGRKSDSLCYIYDDGLQQDTVLIPMNVLATWTVHYGISDSRAKPTTPTYTSNEFTDTLYIYHNKENRTRITSMRMGINFNPRNVKIKDFKIDTTAFPAGWSVAIGRFDSTEKYGKLFFTAQGDSNAILNEAASSPEGLSYFTDGTTTKKRLGTFTGIQLLGTSDTTRFYIDTIYSQHNYSNEFVFPKDTNNVADRIPYIKSTGGINIADSLLFQHQKLLNSKDLSAIIENVYPNPAGQNSDELWVDIKVLKDISTVKFSIIEVIRGTTIKEQDEKITLAWQPPIPIDINGIGSGTYILFMTTPTNTDRRQFQVTK